MMNKRLHTLLHGCTGRRGDLVIVDLDRTGGDLVQALENPTMSTWGWMCSHADLPGR